MLPSAKASGAAIRIPRKNGRGWLGPSVGRVVIHRIRSGVRPDGWSPFESAGVGWRPPVPQAATSGYLSVWSVQVPSVPRCPAQSADPGSQTGGYLPGYVDLAIKVRTL